MPNRYGLSKETIKEFKKGIELLKKAQVYAKELIGFFPVMMEKIISIYV